MKLYPRRPGVNRHHVVGNRKRINRALAHRLLDRYQAGLELQPALVDWALRNTGDFARAFAEAAA